MAYTDLQLFTHNNMLLKEYYSDHIVHCTLSPYKCNTHYLVAEIIKENQSRITKIRVARKQTMLALDQIAPRSTTK